MLRDHLPVIILVGGFSYVPQSRHGDKEGIVLFLLSQTLRFLGFEHAPPHQSHARSSGPQSKFPTQKYSRDANRHDHPSMSRQWDTGQVLAYMLTLLGAGAGT